jgi:hypothetical protein
LPLAEDKVSDEFPLDFLTQLQVRLVELTLELEQLAAINPRVYLTSAPLKFEILDKVQRIRARDLHIVDWATGLHDHEQLALIDATTHAANLARVTGQLDGIVRVLGMLPGEGVIDDDRPQPKPRR